MRRGDFEAAWRVSDAVLRTRTASHQSKLPRWYQSVWNGTPLDGRRVLVRCYHGLGDTIQFIRYTRPLASIAREVIVWAQPVLLPLLRHVAGINRLLPLHDGEPQAAFDVDIEVMELPHAFRTVPSTIPADVPYIHIAAPPRRADGMLRVGLVWAAGDWDACRSVPLALLEPLAHFPGIQLHILQRGPALAECDFGIMSGSDDVLEVARTIGALDLLISVDSMPAHLAGALGTPVWTMLRARADWRWLERREDCPWYPTMRLFRQSTDGDWVPVLNRITAELTRLQVAAARWPAPARRHRSPRL
jgi:hypothetical protein